MPGPYQSLERLRARVEYEPEDLFEDNAEKRFDRLLMGTDAVDDNPSPSWEGLEAEARKIIETRLGDQPLTKETDRQDTIRPGDDAALLLVFPIIDVTKVEYKRTLPSSRDDTEPGLRDGDDVLVRQPNGRRWYPGEDAEVLEVDGTTVATGLGSNSSSWTETLDSALLGEFSAGRNSIKAIPINGTRGEIMLSLTTEYIRSGDS